MTNLPASPWSAATSQLSAPLTVVDLDAFDANIVDLLRRAGGMPLRVASKSVRVPTLIARALAHEGFAGVMAFALGEAMWLVKENITDDVLMGYPTVDETALTEMLNDDELRRDIILMVDNVEHLDQLARLDRLADGAHRPPIQVCIDIDASLRLGPIHIGVRRSPLRTPAGAAALARAALDRGISVRGLMFYEAQVAGLAETGWKAPIIRAMKRLSLAELEERRSVVVDAVQRVAGPTPLLVNGGGSGSVTQTAKAPNITEVTAGSGMFVPSLFDHYSTFTPRPAAFFGLDVVRRPGPGYATAFGGGYIASGPTKPDRAPLPLAGKYVGTEGAGEVQTPLRFKAGSEPAIGDRVWLRHAKAGELMEHFTHVHLVRGSEVENTVTTYRGEGFPFG